MDQISWTAIPVHHARRSVGRAAVRWTECPASNGTGPTTAPDRSRSPFDCPLLLPLGQLKKRHERNERPTSVAIQHKRNKQTKIPTKCGTRRETHRTEICSRPEVAGGVISISKDNDIVASTFAAIFNFAYPVVFAARRGNWF